MLIVFKPMKFFPFILGIKDHIISNSRCVCGATNILVDALFPNKILRDTINQILETNMSSAKNVGSLLQVQGILVRQKVGRSTS